MGPTGALVDEPRPGPDAPGASTPPRGDAGTAGGGVAIATDAPASSQGAPPGGGEHAEGWRARRRQRRSGRRGSWQRPVLVAFAVLVAAQVVLVVVEWHQAGHSGPSTASLPPAAPNDALGRAVDTKTIIADPQVLIGHHVDYMYASSTGFHAPNVPVRTFRTMGKWLTSTDALPTLPAWAGSWVWNPDVRYVQGRYVMWFTALDEQMALPTTGIPPRCLGWATSRTPLGPFVASSTPAICQMDRFGAIDPRTLVTPSGQEWLYWKSDSNAVPNAHMPTEMWAQRLAPDGVTREGHPIPLLSNTKPWEGILVESPQMVRAGKHYYLFFSGNASRTPQNGIGVATCRGPGGPCRDPAQGPWLGTSPQSPTAGEESLYSQDGKTWLLYTPIGPIQSLEVSRVAFGPHGPYVAAFRHLPSVG